MQASNMRRDTTTLMEAADQGSGGGFTPKLPRSTRHPRTVGSITVCAALEISEMEAAFFNWLELSETKRRW